MKIRPAAPGDLNAMVDVVRRIQDSTRLRQIGFSAERTFINLKAVVEDARGIYCLMVAEDATGQIVGGLLGVMERHFFSDRFVATLIGFGVLPERRASGAGHRLLTVFRRWAERRGAVELNAGINSGTGLERSDRYLRRLGFARVGGNYVLSLVKQTQA
jgi:GNAT superfamily N-acetyltransferase